MTMTNPTRKATGAPTKFALSVRLLHTFKDGVPVHVGKGTDMPSIDIPRQQAEKWQKQGLGKIVGVATPVKAKG
jgi:hypothetical protein